MSRLTTTPYNKSSPFDLIRAVQPPSPPDTELEYLGQGPTFGPMHHESVPTAEPGSYSRAESLEYAPNTGTETPGSRLRRLPSLAYHSSGLRAEPRVSQRSATKWLIVVVPPASFSREHGNLGHTLSTNPPGRLSHGVLMPLFPTIYAQLAAIAREFSFPSTAGLCVYLQIAEGGISVTPRVSDESWPFLWAHFLDDRVTSPTQSHGLPVAGRIEFDLDLRKARWYDSWIASSRREFDVGVPAAPSIALTRSHKREESRTTDGQDEADEQTDAASFTTRPRAGSVVRHIPKRLSLLDKLETPSTVSMPRSISRLVQSPPTANDEQALTAHALSPVVQEEEPRTAKQDLKVLVNNWRANSSVAPTPIAAATGQMALDPVNMPNSIHLSELDTPGDDGQELNLDDFTWSISSAGPPTTDPPSPMSFFSMVPTPDLGQRMLDLSLLTPSTATSWGPALDWPASPASEFRAPSVDLGQRNMSSRPATPSTATSWGAPLSWPASPAGDFRAPSVDIGQRGEWSRPATPSTATTWGPPMTWPGTPAAPFYVHTPDAGQRAFDDMDMAHSNSRTRASGRTDIWGHVWPYQNGRSAKMQVAPWSHVWPYQNSHRVGSVSKQAGVTWNHVWPYRTSHHVKPIDIRLPAAYPSFNLYPAVYPNFDLYPQLSDINEEGRGLQFQLEAKYPMVVPYPAVYPQFEIYPGYSVTLQNGFHESLTTKLPANYPAFDLYPAVYPYFDIYPSSTPIVTKEKVAVKLESQTIPVQVGFSYPFFDLYPSGYPKNLDSIYPGLHNQQQDSHAVQSVSLPAKYPAFNLYPSVYPHITPYPSSQVHEQFSTGQGSKRSIASVAESKGSVGAPASIASITACYPTFDLYPAVRPQSDIHRKVPHISTISPTEGSMDTLLVAKYPAFSLYPPVYPFFDLYPAVIASRTDVYVDDWRIVSMALPSKYPAIELYAPVYPFFDLYPGVAAGASAVNDAEDWRTISMALPAKYPAIQLYPAVYPSFNLYPGIAAESSAVNADSDWRKVSMGLLAKYPAIQLYSPVYPFFDLYPGVAAERSTVDVDDDWHQVLMELSAKYPAIQLYTPVYPFFNLYPGIATEDSDIDDWRSVSMVLPAKYPAIQLYAPAYPFFDIYPGASSKDSSVNVKDDWRTVSVVSAAKYPIIELYPPVYYPQKVSNLISPGDAARDAVARAGNEKVINVVLKQAYPQFNLYPASYPAFDIYPTVPIAVVDTSASTTFEARYPAFDIYPAVYPFFDIYHSGSGSTPEYWRESQVASLEVKYPDFNLYPATYPHFDLYNSGSDSGLVFPPSPQPVKLKASYPAFDIYPAVYPFIDLWPAVPVTSIRAPSEYRRPPRTYHELDGVFEEVILPTTRSDTSQVRSATPRPAMTPARKPLRTHKELHDVVLAEPRVESTQALRPKKTHQQLHDLVFAQDSRGLQHKRSHKTLVRKVSFAIDIEDPPSPPHIIAVAKKPAPIIPPKPASHRLTMHADAQKENVRHIGLPPRPAAHRALTVSGVPGEGIESRHTSHSSRTALAEDPFAGRHLSRPGGSPLGHRQTRSLDIDVQRSASLGRPSSRPAAAASGVSSREGVSAQLSSVAEPSGLRRVFLPERPTDGLRRARSVGLADLQRPAASSHAVAQSTATAGRSGKETPTRQLSPVEEAVMKQRIPLPSSPTDGLHRRVKPLALGDAEHAPPAQAARQSPVTSPRELVSRPSVEDRKPVHRIFLPSAPSEGLRRARSAAVPPSEAPPVPPTLERPKTLSDAGATRGPRKRDSIVLEKARAWGLRTAELDAPPLKTKDLTEIHDAPRPPVPPIPTRPITRLDRSKIPFA